jgi:hypothetical protein
MKTKIKHGLLAVACIALLYGCTTAWTILDILADEQPTPVCDKDSAGTEYKNQVCLKYSDGSYKWVKR